MIVTEMRIKNPVAITSFQLEWQPKKRHGITNIGFGGLK